MKLQRACAAPSEDPAVVSVNEAFDRLRIAVLIAAALLALLTVAGAAWSRDILAEQRRTRAELAKVRAEQTAWESRVVDRLDRVELTPVHAWVFSRDGWQVCTQVASGPAWRGR